MQVKELVLTLLVSCAVGLTVGCRGSVEPENLPTAAGSVTADVSSTPSMVLNEMPPGDVMTPTEVMEQGEGEVSVVLAGRIDAGSMDPFQPGEIAFMISQLPDEGHGEGDPDHADNCPFCKRKLENAPRAIVQFRDAEGQVIAGDPRQVLALEKGDVVYVTGMASYNVAVNTVMVDATGVYRKR